MIDIEPLLVIIFNLNYPLHGLAHSFLGATLIGLLWGFIVFRYRNVSAHFMEKIKFPYVTNLGKAILSGILGGWFHVLLDAPIYADIRPFYPVSRNPFYGLLDDPKMYLFCAICFVPAFALYFIIKNIICRSFCHAHDVSRFYRIKSTSYLTNCLICSSTN
jgi:membrane-bound metal-dependent hydrolase YbcI (DUF457 family)